MDFEDKVIVCGDCGKEFTHTAEDQQRYAERGFSEAPKRCRECRQARKDKAASAPARPPRRPQGESRGGGRGGFQGRPRSSEGGHYSRPRGPGGGSFGPRDRGGPRPSFEVVCAACGATTTVPFEPTPGRAVYCRDCFRKLKDEG